MPKDKINKFVLIDRDIPHARELFCGFRQLELFDPVKGLDQIQDLDRVEVLIIRSTFKVDQSILDKMPRLEFIGTTTAGQDHITVKENIKVVSAPGCNAGAVCDYVYYALFSLENFLQHWFQTLKFGIVGVGNVGSRVWKRAVRFGFQPVLVDPPRVKRARKFRGAPFEALYKCDIVSLHVPLTSEGEYPTAHMIRDEFFERIKPGTIFINTSRGGVVDEDALIRYRRKLGGIILDVYQNEPTPRIDLIDIAHVSTPHIAGHSHQSFYRGALMVAKKCYRYFQRSDLAFELDRVETLYHKTERQIPSLDLNPMDEFKEILRSTFDIHAATKQTKQQALSFSAESFAQLRQQLRRDENRFITLSFAPSKSHHVPHLLTNMGFRLKK
jgi:erythronate-4-phosphate dehydrogenase